MAKGGNRWMVLNEEMPMQVVYGEEMLPLVDKHGRPVTLHQGDTLEWEDDYSRAVTVVRLHRRRWWRRWLMRAAAGRSFHHHGS